MKKMKFLRKSLLMVCVVVLTILTAMHPNSTNDQYAMSKEKPVSAEFKDQESHEAQVRSRQVHFNVMSNYRNYYAGYEPLCFTAITPGPPDAYGLHISFGSNMPGFSHIEYAKEDGDYQVLKNNTLFVALDRELDVVYDVTYQIKPVFSSPEKELVYSINVNCFTIKAIEKLGGTRAKDIIKIRSDPHINYGTNNPENWMTFIPKESEIAFAQKQWGHLLEGVSSDYEKAMILTKALMRELRGHGGLPQALLRELRAFEKYEAITAGKSGYACGQYSEIFSMACNSFGVINRRGFIHDNLQSDEMFIELGSSHLVTEIFDRDLNEWIFIDSGRLGAYLGDVGPLTLHEFFLFMNQPNRRSRLKILYYDPVKDEEQMMHVDDYPGTFRSYIGWTKGFHTRYRGTTQAEIP